MSRTDPLRRCNRRGMTLVELLVVIAIIGILVALLLPAVQAVRAAARRTMCFNNMRQLGLGLHSYHDIYHRFPPGGVEPRTFANPDGRQLAWCVFLLPDIEQVPLYHRIDLGQPFDAPVNGEPSSIVLNTFLCPSVPGGRELRDGRGPCHYGGIYGERITSPNSPPKGVMLYDRAISIQEITDGTAHTLVVSEDSHFGDGQWINGRNVFDQAFPINRAPWFENDIRSEHAGGANGLFCDGSTRFLVESMDLVALAAVCTRAGGEIVRND